MNAKQPKELDVVELTRSIERWPVGTEGTVLEDEGDHFLVEAGTEKDADELGLMGVLVDVPCDAVRVVWRPGDPTGRLPAGLIQVGHVSQRPD